MRNPEQVLNILAGHSNEPAYKYERLYRILFNEQMFFVAYQRMYAKPGNMTPGTDGKTEDEMSIDRINKLIESIKDETYSPNPAKRIYIPKKNGKMRPLGIPSFEDKLVQEVVRMVLEAIYEGHFEWTSHGFRPNRSCHTIRKFLNAGYMEEWQFNKTYSGTPQGGIISPVLANIYLDKFDKYMNEYANKFNKGTVRSRNKDICKLNSRVHYLKRRINEVEDANVRTRMVEELHEKQKRILTMPSGNDMDRNFRRLRYVRYADDFLIGVIGTKNECETIKADITKFMQEKLRLEMSQEKTLITNAQDSAKFLGYEIYVRKDYATKRNSNGTVRRHFNGNVILHVSREVIKNKLLSLEAMKVVTKHGKETWVSKGRTYMIDNEAHEIVAQFNTEIRGFYNYYSIANNASALGRSFGCIMKFSMYKTLAQKLNMSVRKVIETYRKDNLFAVPFVNKGGETKYRVFYNEGYARKTDCETAPSDNLPYMFKTPSLSLIERLTTKTCELCGKHGEVTMHHVRTLKELKGKNDWERKMLYMHRKTLVVCAECNAKIQSCDK